MQIFSICLGCQAVLLLFEKYCNIVCDLQQITIWAVNIWVHTQRRPKVYAQPAGIKQIQQAKMLSN